MNGVRYSYLVTDYLRSKIENLNLDDVRFQQDGPTYHTANETIIILRQKLNGRVLSRRGDVNQPPPSVI